MTDNLVKGTPPPVLLPAKNYIFKLPEDRHTLVIPRQGKYSDLDPEFFSEDDGHFNVFNEETQILLMKDAIKVLFATRQYPDMNFNQFFVIEGCKIQENEVIIIGHIIDMMIPVENKDENKEEE